MNAVHSDRWGNGTAVIHDEAVVWSLSQHRCGYPTAASKTGRLQSSIDTAVVGSCVPVVLNVQGDWLRIAQKRVMPLGSGSVSGFSLRRRATGQCGGQAGLLPRRRFDGCTHCGVVMVSPVDVGVASPTRETPPGQLNAA